jgi:alpha-L-rhamnosidase
MWPETPGKTRSDSPAWSGHPTYDLLALVAVIEPGRRGFASARIAPRFAGICGGVGEISTASRDDQRAI